MISSRGEFCLVLSQSVSDTTLLGHWAVMANLFYGTIFVCCKYVSLSLVHKEMTDLQLGRKRQGRRVRLGCCWEEKGGISGVANQMQRKQAMYKMR